jgi:hypothetical protein
MNESNLNLLACPLSFRNRVTRFALATLVVLLINASVLAQDAPPRPATEDLLPETTVVYFQVDNVQETIPRMFGAGIMEDENIAPFLERMYEEAETAYAESVQDKVGMTLEQIRELPTGEMCVALIAPRRKNLEVLVAIELDTESESAQAALGATETWKDQLSDQGLTETIEADESGVEIYTFDIPDAPRQAHAFVRDGWFVSCTSRDELAAILARWEGQEVKKVRPLSKNRKFVTIMNRCRDTKDIQPELRFFIDPISLARSGFRGNAAALAAMNFLPTVGLDGILALGGSAAFQSEQFNGVFHGHLLLANPRAGILEMLALKPGESKPQPWVPADASNYASTHWDPQQLVTEMEKLIDLINGEGEFQTNGVEALRDSVGLDLYTDIVEPLDGRLTFTQWSNQDADYLLNAVSNSVAVGLDDVDKAREVIDALIESAREQGRTAPKVIDYEGVTIWVVDRPNKERRERREKRVKERMGDIPMRFAEPAFCLLDSSLVICDSVDMLKHLVDVSLGNADALAQDDEYNEQMQTLLKAVGSDVPCAVTYSKPDGPIKDLVRLVNDDRSKAFLDSMSEIVPALGRLRIALDEQPMPDYEQLERHLKPAGMIVTTDDTGYHLLTFQYAGDED